MSSDETVDSGRRNLLVASAAVGGVAEVVAAIPFGLSMLPSERAKAAGAPVEVDISDLLPGQMKTVEWRGKPVWIINRTTEQLASLRKTDDLVSDPKSEKLMQPEYCQNWKTRSIKPDILVAVGICTHLGGARRPKSLKPGSAESGISADWPGGFICPCHDPTFDLAGRVYKSKPAPDNLEVPRTCTLATPSL